VLEYAIKTPRGDSRLRVHPGKPWSFLRFSPTMVVWGLTLILFD